MKKSWCKKLPAISTIFIHKLQTYSSAVVVIGLYCIAMLSVTDNEYCEKLAENLWDQAVKGDGTDVILQCGGSSFSAHSCVLRMYPDFLEAWKIGSEAEFKDSSMDADIFQKILKFFYTGNIVIPNDSFAKVEFYSINYKLNSLAQLCKIYQEQEQLKKDDGIPVDEGPTVVVESISDQEKPPVKKKRKKSKKFRCLQCKEIFTEVSELSEHYANHSEGQANFCKNCGIKFTNGAIEKDHVCIVDCSVKEADTTCQYCMVRCETMPHLSEHEGRHRCKKCNKIFDNIGACVVHDCGDRNEKTVYECSQCGKLYSSKQCFVNHLKLHKGENSLTCQFCDRVFHHHLPFKKHMLTYTSGKVQHQCKVCEEKFRLKIKFYAHCIKSGHMLHEVPFKCTVCDSFFSNGRDLNSHARVHCPEKPYKCADCPKTYSSKLGLKLHVESVHLKQISYRCGECEKTFSQPSHLAEHKKLHLSLEKEFVCSFCGMHLSCKANLRRHESIHTGDRDFACPECPKKYSLRMDLNRHKRKVHANADDTRC